MKRKLYYISVTYRKDVEEMFAGTKEEATAKLNEMVQDIEDSNGEVIDFELEETEGDIDNE